MKPIFIALIVSITCAEILSAQVIEYEIDISFNSGLTFNRGSVDDLLLHDNGDVLLTGNLNNVGSPAQSISSINSSGELITTMGTVGSVFNLQHYLGNYINYGWSGITRFDFPGVFVPPFNFEFSKSIYSGGLSNSVKDALVLPDDHILVAGRFFTDSTLMGTAQSHLGLRQLCMIDSTGSPVSDFPMLRCAQPVNAEIYSIRQLSTGQYIITGRFSEVEGHVTNSMARLNADFTVDTTFVSPLLTMRLVRAMYIDSQDRTWLYIEQGVLSTNPSDTIWGARLLVNGAVDPFFNIPEIYGEVTTNPPANNGIFDGYFTRVFEDNDGTFIVTGGFTNFNGAPRKGIAKIYDDGSLVSGVFDNWGADEAVWGSYSGHPGCGVYPLPDGKLMIGGQFSSFGGEPYSCLVRLQPSGFVGTDDREGNARLQLWPNPASTTLHFHLPGGTLTRASLHDMQGRQVLEVQLKSSAPAIDVSTLPKGMYLLRAMGQNGAEYVKKLVVD